MAIVFTGSKTVTHTLAPHLTGAALTTILAIAPELWTVGQLKTITDACARVTGGDAEDSVIGALLT